MISGRSPSALKHSSSSLLMEWLSMSNFLMAISKNSMTSKLMAQWSSLLPISAAQILCSLRQTQAPCNTSEWTRILLSQTIIRCKWAIWMVVGLFLSHGCIFLQDRRFISIKMLLCWLLRTCLTTLSKKISCWIWQLEMQVIVRKLSPI